MANLTLALLAAMAEALPPPPPRIIVGMPNVGDNEVLEAKEPALILMGRGAYEKLRAHAKPYDRETDPFGLTFGLRIEFFGDEPDHVEFLHFKAASPEDTE